MTSLPGRRTRETLVDGISGYRLPLPGKDWWFCYLDDLACLVGDAPSPRPPISTAHVMNTGLLPPLPLKEREATKDTLQLWAQIIGKTRLALVPTRNHW